MGECNKACNVVRKLVEDLPGAHWYVLNCSVCHRDVSDEWVERRWGSSDTPATIRPHSCSSPGHDLGDNAQGNAP
jgi:hypothetical protein